MRYVIDSAISETAGDPGFIRKKGSKPMAAPAWNLIFSNHIEFEAADDADAYDHAESLQRRHNSAYLMLCYGATPSGFDQAPRYVDRLFSIDVNGALHPVLP